MPKLLPILSMISMQHKDLEFLPRFETFPKHTVYDAERGRDTIHPYCDFRVRMLGDAGAMQQERLMRPADFLAQASSPDLRSTHVPIDTWREMLASVSDISQSGYGIYTYFDEVYDNTLASRGTLMQMMEIQGPPRIYIADGYAFHLMGDAEDDDPAGRLINTRHLRDHDPDLSKRLDLADADYFLGVSIWGQRAQSSHARLQLSKFFAQVWPIICPELANLEVMPAIARPDPNSDYDWIRRTHILPKP